MKFLRLILRNIRRNLLRSVLTALGTMVLVLVVTLVWSILMLLDLITAEKSENVKVLVTEKWSIPSRLPMSYANTLAQGAALEPDDVRPLDWMAWQFYGGSTEKDKITRESLIFAIATDPSKVLTMLDGMEGLTPEEEQLVQLYVERMKTNLQGIILGANHLRNTNKRIGDRIKLYGMGNFKGLDLEFEIVGVFPPGRYDTLAAFHSEYYARAFDAYERDHGGHKHPLAERSLNLVWLKVADTAAFNRVAAQIENSPYYTDPAVKCETASSGYAAFMDAFRDLIFFMRWYLTTACIVTLAMIIANAISISVRERRMEFAVLKVLGFEPAHIMLLVLAEALLIGAGAGLASAALTYTLINHVMGGLPLQLGFFSRFFIPVESLFWGPYIGGGAALAGSILPAWSACRVKVVDVFSKVA